MKKITQYQICTKNDTSVNDVYYKSLPAARKAAKRAMTQYEWILPRSLPLTIWKLEKIEEVK